MSHLRLVKEKPAKRPKRRGSHEYRVFSDEEQRRARAALHGLKKAAGGTWAALAAILSVPKSTVACAARGTFKVSPALLVRASLASGLSIQELLAPLRPAEKCVHCGGIRRRVA